MSTTPLTAATPMSRRRAVAVALCLAVVVLLGCALRPAAAAQLPLRQAAMTSVSIAERCAPAVTATNGTVTSGRATTVLLTGLGSGCGGRVVAVTLFGARGAALTSVTTTLPASTTGSATVIVPAYSPADVSGAAMTVGTWGVPASWTYAPPPVVPTVSCAVLNDPSGRTTCEATNLLVEAWGGPPLTTYNAYVTVSSTSARDVEWQITINLADPVLKLNANVMDSNNAVQLAPGWTCAARPMLVLRGQENPGTKYVGNGRTVTVWMQGKASPVPTTGGSLFNCS